MNELNAGQPLVSVCIPVYNFEKYIGETLDSLVTQTYSNIEIIVSDNASTDNTPGIIREIAKKDPRIKLLSNKTNIGYVNNVNKLVDSAASEYVAIYHGDDLYGRTMIEKELNVLLADNAVGGVFVKQRSFYENSNRIKIPAKYSSVYASVPLVKKGNYFSGGLNDYLSVFSKDRNVFMCPSLITRKSVYKEAGGFSDKYPTNEDLDLWFRILRNGYKLAIVNEYLLDYCKKQSSLDIEMRAELAVYYKVIDDFIKENNVKLDEKDLINYKTNKAKGYLTAAYNACVKGDWNKYHNNVGFSRKEYAFSILSIYGLFQKIPILMCAFRRAVRLLKSSIYRIRVVY